MTNALIRETSPYLLQHAHNPVDWHAWGTEAFELARQTGRPIFLSVGYSTCYWCHVMERQSFENHGIAALMNESFVCVKVDREERPDVDDIYMTAVQAMTGRGGWPMSVFLTPPGAEGEDDPGLKPFYAGTYFPPEGGHGMPSFPQVLSSLAGAWSQQRQQVIEQAREVAKAIRGHLGHSLEVGPCDATFVQQAGNQLLHSIDAEHGGFGSAPKFPQPANLQLLIHIHRNNPNPQLWDAIALTLRRMAMGGMYDQVGGGFHRYSTDEKWLVPHFEKMLYDNGQLVEAYLDASAVQEDPLDPGLYARIVRQTCDYALREMTDDSGAFWSAQDAEVDALEGGNYLWSLPEVEIALAGLSEDDRNLARVMYGLNDGPNFRDPHHPDAPAKNVLHLPVSIDALAAAKNTTINALVAAKTRIDAKLLETRNQRRQPATDDKVIVSWNGMMIAALARAGGTLRESRYTQAASRASQAILDRMVDGEGELKRTLRKGVAHTDGFLEDYAFFAHGLIELHRATDQGHWLEGARLIMQSALARFGIGGGGYFDTRADRPDLLVRSVSTHDGAVPAGSSRMIHNWIDLSQRTDDPGCFEQAVKDLRAMSSVLRRSGAMLAHMQHALLRTLEINSAPLLAGAEAAGDASRRQPVEVSIEPRKYDWAAPVVQLEIALRIHREYHLSAGDPGLVGRVPTEVRLIDSPGWTMDVKYPPGEEKLYDFADRAIRVYEGEARIGVSLRNTGRAAGRPRLLLRYQVCTDRSCLEPREVDLSAMLQR